jgi:hypothetical protein
VHHGLITTVAAGALACLAGACSTAGVPTRTAEPAASASATGSRPAHAAGSVRPTSFDKRVSFSILEDYDKGEDLAQVARDFALMKELGVTTWRGSFGWDDYEPSRGSYDFAWLHKFAELAQREGIELRPYVGYTPPWAARAGGVDSAAWNDPPSRLDDWYRFVYNLAAAMRRHPNVRSYEIYNEQNARLWWDGTAADYNAVLERGAAAVRAADADAQLLMGGTVFPDVEWMEATCVAGRNAASFDVLPFHAYPETWTPDSVVVENYLGADYLTEFLPTVDEECGEKPIWINEAGFATTPGKSERDQAEWWARAFATFLADPRVEHIGIYEIKDLRTDSPVIGDAPNYHLGLTRVDRTRKLAFHTVDLLTDLLDVGTLTVADGELTTAVTAGSAGSLHRHLFVRPDGRQVLFLWDRSGSPTLQVALARPGSTVTEYALDGTPSRYAPFDGRTLRDVRLEPGAVRMFEVAP